MDRRTYEDWSKDGGPALDPELVEGEGLTLERSEGMTLKERAQKKVVEILNTHRPEPIEDDIASEIEKIIQSAECRVTKQL
jgi:trimethylamine:corrinoid methyltransferase-like protein